MTSKVRAGRRGWDLEPVPGSDERNADPDLEAEVALAEARFDALAPELREYLDVEALRGREAYAWP